MTLLRKLARAAVPFVLGATALLAPPLVVTAGASEHRGHVTLTSPAESTGHGGLRRDGWYPGASLLTPSNVTSGNFGQLFSTPIVGQAYAQPLMDGPNVIVATEQNWVYAIDQVTGKKQWSVQVGADIGAQPFNAVQPTVNSLEGWDCPDLAPYVGITSTPVIDPSTGVIYLVAMEQLVSGRLGYFVHALDGTTGQEQVNFPVEVKGAAQNNSSAVFDAYNELQRTALTLTGGSVYFGFAGHCDQLPYQGYVAGVSTSGELKALWTDVTGTDGSGGLWQSGGGFASDGKGQLLVAVGNGSYGSSPSGSISGSTPPSSLGESSVRLVAQPDGTLKATDFFTPFNALALDNDDLDYGSGSPVLLPPSFGTSSYPNLLVQTGKEGYVYLLDAHHLGGVGQGPGGGDDVLSSIGTYGGAWTTPAVWPGDGGFVFIPTATGGTNSLGNASQGDLNVFDVNKPSTANDPPTLALKAVGPMAMGFGTSAPVVTSNGTKKGSGVVWMVRTTNGAGLNAELQAYNATPTPGAGSSPGGLQLLGQWPIGTAMKFTPPGIANNRVYVVNRDGQLLAFGLNAQTLLRGGGATYPGVVTGQTSSTTLTFTAAKALSLRMSDTDCGICTKTSDFQVLSTSSKAKGGVINLQALSRLSVTVAFRPQGKPGAKADVLRLVTSLGEVDVPLLGTARAATPWIGSSTAGLNMKGYTIGQRAPATARITVTNFGNAPAQVASMSSNISPFSVSSVLRVGSILAAGASAQITVSFSSSSPGLYHDTFNLTTTTPGKNGAISVDLMAVASTPPSLSISTSLIDFGTTLSGTSTLKAVTIANDGGSTMVISRLRMTNPAFQLLHPPSTDIGVVPGSSVTLELLFVPTTSGNNSGSLEIKPNGIASTSISLVGIGTGTGFRLPSLGAPGWQYGGSSTVEGETIALTADDPFSAGSAFWPVPVSSRTLSVNFRGTAREGSGGDGLTFTLLDTSAITTETSSPVGGPGELEGFGGLPGVAIVIGEQQATGSPGDSWVGVSNGTTPDGNALNLLASAKLPSSIQDTTNVYSAAFVDGAVTIWCNGIKILTTAVTLPSSYLVGFTAGSGLLTNFHEVSDVTISAGGQETVATLEASPTTFNLTPTAGQEVGTSIVGTYLLTNTSNSIERLDRPILSGSQAFQLISERSMVLTPGAATLVTIGFQPRGPFTEYGDLAVPINGGTSIVHVPVAGTGIGRGAKVGSFVPLNFSVNGSAKWVNDKVQLTPPLAFQSGSCLARTPVPSSSVTVSLNLSVTHPTQTYPGADGTAIVFAPGGTSSQAVGDSGAHDGFIGLHGLAVFINEQGEAGDAVTRAGNFVGIVGGLDRLGRVAYLATAAIPASIFNQPTALSVSETTTLGVTSISVMVNGARLLAWSSHNSAQSLPSSIKVGVTAGTGSLFDDHTISRLVVTSAI
ncbi:MAG: choice-of-anchor D domain-containing protein [Actinomycetota bacterium]